MERVEQGTSLVDQAGTTMTEVVGSIQRVTQIMGEISVASSEQSAGVSQVGEAVTHMDQATQQNAALVEEMAAAASSLKTQAGDLVQVVGAFKLGAHTAQHPHAVPARTVASRHTPAVAAPARPVARSAPTRPVSAPAPAARKPLPAKPIKLSAPKPSAPAPKPAAGAESDWESF